MNTEIIIAILSFIGTAIGSIVGILTSNKLLDYRLSQLESKVNKHNNLIERMYNVEERVSLTEHDIESLKGQICNE